MRPTREPRIPAFLATGAFLGGLVFLLVDHFGPQGGPFTQSSTTGYMLVVGISLGLILGAVAAAVVSSLRR